MVTLSQATNLHKATDALDGEPSAQEHHQISVKTWLKVDSIVLQ